MSDLVIVESPSKAKTIKKYLGPGYKVMASVGHVIDLPKSKLGVDLEKEYEPQFVTIKGKGAVIKKLKDSVPDKGTVYLAMDPDREGEAIAWHIANALKLKSPKRIVFHEITKNAINEAMEKPRKIDQDLVNAQIARRVLDRLVGYKVSEVLWKKIWYGLSAGRVQSAALKLIVEREKEIEEFIPEEYWDIIALSKADGNKELRAKLSKISDKKAEIKDKAGSDAIKKDLTKEIMKVSEVKKKKVSKSPFPPYTTSTLQQSANNVLGYTAKRTMSVAQALYQAGYITYMRTDSFFLADQAINAIREKILKDHGEKYLPEKAKHYKNGSRNAQEAHEAIRPTDFKVSKAIVEKDLGRDHARLYSMIMDRAVASQMANRESEVLSIILTAIGKSKKKYEFQLGAEKVLFDGFRKLLKTKATDKGEEDVIELENINQGDKFPIKGFDNTQHFTKPKPRYTDASLVKALEKHGIGRPSTYATIISTVQDRGYVEKIGKYLKPLDVGVVVSHFLENNFTRLVDYEYTADVEDRLDKISEGKEDYVKFMDREYKPLVKEMKLADKEVIKDDVVILSKSDEKCEECGSPMVVRLGRYGKFFSCTKFPDCKGMKSIDGGEDSIDFEKYHRPEECPDCGKQMNLKIGKYGKFWACENYPECKGSLPMLLNEECPDCGKKLVERKSKWGRMFIGCTGYPDCTYIKKEKKKETEEDDE